MKRVFAHIGFSMAITLLVLNLIAVRYVIVITIGLAIIFVASLVLSKFRKALTVPLCLGTALVGCFIFMINYGAVVQPQQYLDGKEASISFYYVDIPEADDDEFIYTIKTTNVDLPEANNEMKMRLKLGREIQAEPYQIVNASVKFYSIGDTAFDSYGYWADNIFLTARASSVYVTDNHVKSPLKRIYDLRLDMINTFDEYLGGDNGGLASALVTGYRGNLSKALINSFKYSGAMHITAVSGFHLTVSTAGFFLLLKLLKSKEKYAIPFVMAFVLICVALAGFSKSVVRAGIMMLVLLLGRMVKNRADSLNSLGFATLIICLNPFAVTDIGACLSVVSSLALITFSTLFNFKGFRAIVAAISILFFTMPIMFVFFGYINLAGILSSFIVVPIGSCALVLAIISFFAIKVNFLASAFVWLTVKIVKLLIKAIDLIASLKFLTVSLPNDFVFVLAGVFVIFAVIYFLGNMKLIKPACAVSALMIAVSIASFNCVNINSARMLVTENGACAIICDSKTVVYGIESKGDYYSVRSFLFANNSKIDAVILENTDVDSVEYSLALADDFSCDEIVSPGFEIDFFDNENLNRITILNDYNNELTDNFSISAVKKSQMNYCLFDVNGVTITVGNNILSNSTIVVNNNKIIDDKGSILLDNGDIIYTIYNDSTYSVGRMRMI